jgi:hypothetical protein
MAAALLPKAFPFAPATTLARALCRGEIGAVARAPKAGCSGRCTACR